MVIANGGWPGSGLFLAVAVGGYLAAGAANAINMVLDRDIDATMKRTSSRPTVTQLIPVTHALAFGIVCAIASFALLAGFANFLTALLAIGGLLFYVFVYTIGLKRRTWHNIVIGGAAGAFPPLVGWAAVTNELSPLAWLLFALIFVWTPVHFWALAIVIKDDYASAGVPMLPVVKGEKATVAQIAIYSVLTAVVSVSPILLPGVGLLYLTIAVASSVCLMFLSFALQRQPERKRAFLLFKFSMAYLAVLFLALALDRSLLS
jgi:protoheme IX farnesyltransferase